MIVAPVIPDTLALPVVSQTWPAPLLNNKVASVTNALCVAQNKVLRPICLIRCSTIVLATDLNPGAKECRVRNRSA